MQGVEPVSLDFRPGSGGVPQRRGRGQADHAQDARHRPDLAQQSDRRGLSARDHPRLLRAGASSSGIALLLDETYKDFLPEGTRPHELFSDPDWRGTLVHLYSFSKVFALTGYRVGGVTAGAALIAEIEKAMDCVSICPPRLGQEAALYGLRNLLPWARENTEGLKARADLLGNGLRAPTAGGWSASAPISPMSSIPSPASARPPCPSGWPTRRTCSPFPATCSARARSASCGSPSPTWRRQDPGGAGTVGAVRRLTLHLPRLTAGGREGEGDGRAVRQFQIRSRLSRDLRGVVPAPGHPPRTSEAKQETSHAARDDTRRREALL